MKNFISNSINDTKIFGKNFAKFLQKGDLIILNGDLGAGKTAFVSGVLSYFGKEDEVSSPTFTIINEHVINEDLSIFHFDVYRLENEDEFYAIGGEEYFDKGISFIEWGDTIKDALPKEYLEIKIEKDNDDENVRIFNLIPHGEKYISLLQSVEENTVLQS